MKKILFSLLMLCCMTAAWAGDGNGTKETPYTGEWEASILCPMLRDGDYLAYDCVIKNGYVTIKDIRLNQEVATTWPAWSPGNLIGDPKTGSKYEQYGKDNLPDDRKGQLFIVKNASRNTDSYYKEYVITGYFNGFYRGIAEADGFYQVYTAPQMKIVINGSDHAKVRLMKDIYMSDLGLGESGRHTFCSTFYGILDGNGHTIWAASPEVQHDGGGHYHRQYLFTYSDGAQFRNLTFKDFRVQSEDNHNQAVITSQAKNGCVFENITFDNISIFCNNDNAGAIAGRTYGNCTLTNIKVANSDFTVDGDQSGALVGHAEDCKFTNIEVKNCDSTSDDEKSGAVVGRSDRCTFDNVNIFGCDIETYGKYAGGVAGYSTNSKYSNCFVDDHTSVFADNGYGGGVAAFSTHDEFANCTNSGVVAADEANVGGVAGYAENDTKIESCLNTGIIMLTDEDKMDNFMSNVYHNLPIVERRYNGTTYDVRTEVGVGNYDYFNSGKCGGIVGTMMGVSVSKCGNIGYMACANATPNKNTACSIGGIAGGVEKSSSISDCFGAPLMDVQNLTTHGILGCCTSDKATVVKNCLSITANPNYIFHPNENIESVNNYSNCGDDEEMGVETFIKFIQKTGELAVALGTCWEQDLGTDPYPTPTGNRGLYHTRWIVQKDYVTVCVPFKLASIKGEREYYTFNDVKEEADGSMSLCFQYADEVPAGTPAIFRVGLNTTYSFDAADKDYQFEPQSVSHSDWTLEGTYNQLVFTNTKNIYYLNGKYKNSAIMSANQISIAPYRAYFRGPNKDELTGNGTSEAKSIRFVLADEDGSTTAIEYVGEDLVPVQKSGKTYSLMGTEVGEGYRGIVIRNGKKVLRK